MTKIRTIKCCLNDPASEGGYIDRNEMEIDGVELLSTQDTMRDFSKGRGRFNHIFIYDTGTISAIFNITDDKDTR